MQKHLLMFAKLAVSVALITWVLGGIDFAEVLGKLADAQIPWIGLAALFFAAIVALGTARWRLVLRSLNVELPATTALRLFLIGMFFNQTLPSSIGGDAMRVFYLWRTGVGVQTATNSVLLDRIIGLIVLIVATTAITPLLVEKLDNPIAATGLIAVLTGGWSAVVMLCVFDNSLTRRFQHIRIINFAILLSRDAVALCLRPGVAIPTLCLSIAIHAATIALAWSLDHALGGEAGFLVYMVAMTPTILLVSIPISIAGWGVREQILVILLGALGIGATQAVSVSILFGIVLLVGGLPGGVLWLVTKRPPR
ncbi:MAG: lysylphosphatidylglycerol synthase transmembrane domain-containing protein [Alphaproteobacteria bacterium]